jgi:amidase
MSTFITKLDAGPGDGPTVAVKDIIDVVGVPTTAGSRVVERRGEAADLDAACLSGAREAGARLVGKANLQELAMLPIGTNPWFGTPTNPLDADLVPGGSSSGSAVAVATGEADVAIGSDTGGSIRVPSACCGTTGLKTTYGRVPMDGVWPLAPSLDTLGPMARDVAGVLLGMQLLEPGFRMSADAASVVGRIRTAAHPDIEDAVDRALAATGLEVVTLDWDGLAVGGEAFLGLFFSEIWAVHHELVEADPDDVGEDTTQAIALAATMGDGLPGALEAQGRLRASLESLFDRVQLLALPTLPVFPPRLDALSAESLFPTCIELTAHVAPFNAAGVPATAQPVPTPGHRTPASLQLVGPAGGEELLVATAAVVEAANR